jgi:phosphoglycolate phosphatase-like HAD superfamily hydrolase
MIRGIQDLPDAPVLGLLTGNILLGAQIKLGHYGLWQQFRTGAFGDDHEDRNRVAVIARERGARLLGSHLSGEQILVIGDTPRDTECAKAIGARSLAVATGKFTVEELRADAPTWAVATLTEITPQEVCG